MTLISSVGGASGPLYGTVFLRAATAVMGKEELTPSELAELLQAGIGHQDPGATCSYLIFRTLLETITAM